MHFLQLVHGDADEGRRGTVDSFAAYHANIRGYCILRERSVHLQYVARRQPTLTILGGDIKIASDNEHAALMLNNVR